MPEDTNNSAGGSMLRHFPKPFVVRQDNALTLPEDLMAMLEWSAGDRCWFTVDIQNHKLIVSPSPPSGERGKC